MNRSFQSHRHKRISPQGELRSAASSFPSSVIQTARTRFQISTWISSKSVNYLRFEIFFKWLINCVWTWPQVLNIMTKTCNALGHFGSNNPQEIWDPKLKQMLPMLPTEEDFKRKRQRKEARKHKRYSGPVWFPHTPMAHIPSKFENTYKATLNHLKNKNSLNIWLFVHDKKIAGESWSGEPTGHCHVACALPHLRKRGWPGLARSG